MIFRNGFQKHLKYSFAMSFKQTESHESLVVFCGLISAQYNIVKVTWDCFEMKICPILANIESANSIFLRESRDNRGPLFWKLSLYFLSTAERNSIWCNYRFSKLIFFVKLSCLPNATLGCVNLYTGFHT